MCCQPCCLVCGCQSVDVTVDTPPGYPQPPKTIFCPKCDLKSEVVYRKEYTMCSLCFIPIPCCPCGVSVPFLACNRCNFPLGSNNYKECTSCGVSGIDNLEFCANCGSNNFRNSFESNRMNQQSNGSNANGANTQQNGANQPKK